MNHRAFATLLPWLRKHRSGGTQSEIVTSRLNTFWILVIIGAIGAVILALISSMGVAANVYQVSAGKVTSARGAEVKIYKDKNGQKFFALMGSASDKKFTAELLNLIHDYRAHRVSPEQAELIAERLYFSHCETFKDEANDFLSHDEPVVTTSTDLKGRFRTRLLPGTYLIRISSDTGEWLESESSTLHKDLQFSHPHCSYK